MAASNQACALQPHVGHVNAMESQDASLSTPAPAGDFISFNETCSARFAIRQHVLNLNVAVADSQCYRGSGLPPHDQCASNSTQSCCHLPSLGVGELDTQLVERVKQRAPSTEFADDILNRLLHRTMFTIEL